MPQGVLDYFAIEAIGAASSFNTAIVDHVIMEVGGNWTFGAVQLDQFTLEVIGQSSYFSVGVVDHFSLECIGQWAGF